MYNTLLLCAAALQACAAFVPLPLESQQLLLGDQPIVANKLHLTNDLLGLHKNLTQIESITYNELEVGTWLDEFLREQGYSTELQKVEKDRYNVLAWPGKSPKARTLITSHIDTVPPFLPYKVSHKGKGTVIAGRGSVDAKGSVTAQIIATNQLLSENQITPNDVALLFVVGEELGGHGMRRANSLGLAPQTVIFGEPTEGKLASGHKGNMAFTIKAIGKAAHSGYPWLGRSANEVLVKALAALMELGPNLPSSDKYGSSTVNIGKISGGVAGNVVAKSAEAEVTIRIAAGTPKEFQGLVLEAINAATMEFKDGDEDVVEVDFRGSGYGPIDIDHDVSGFGVMTVNYGTDIPSLEQTVDGQKRYLYGPGSILVAHSDHEAITVDELEDAVKGYKKLILSSLQL